MRSPTVAGPAAWQIVPTMNALSSLGSRRPLFLLLGALAIHLASAQNIAPDYEWSTLAGQHSVGVDDGPGGKARFNYPQAICSDAGGSVYVCDTGNHTIRRIDPAGNVTTVAGFAGIIGYTDAAGADARLTSPCAITAGLDGTIYFADRARTLRAISSTGQVTTVAGQRDVPGQQDGPLAVATFTRITALAGGPAGEIYAVDGSRIRRVADGAVSTLLTFDDVLPLAGTATQFSVSAAIAVSPSGDLYIGGSFYEPNGNQGLIRPGILRRSTAGGWSAFYVAEVNTIGSVADISGLAVLMDGTVVAALKRGYPANNQLCLIALDGTETSLGFTQYSDGSSLMISALAPRPAGGFYALRADNMIVRYSADGNWERFAGTATGTSELDGAASLALDLSGNVWVATLDRIYTLGRPSTSESLLRISPTGTITTVVGAAFIYDVHYSVPALTAADNLGNVYFMHGVTRMDRLDRIDPSGVFAESTSFLSGSPAPTYPSGDCVMDPAGNLILAEASSGTIWKRTPAGVWSVLAGGGPDRFVQDGTGTDAKFNQLGGMCRDTAGNFHVLDTVRAIGELYGCYIRRITPAGQVTTINYNLVLDLTVAGGERSAPSDLVVDSLGNYYLAYPGAGVVMRFAQDRLGLIGGSLFQRGLRDGIGDEARFSYPAHLAIDDDDRLYVLDTDGVLRVGLPITAPPVISAHPLSQTARVGDTVRFNVVAEGWPTPLYEWQFNNSPMPNSNTASLILTNVQANQAGTYWVRVMNSAGVVHSNPATLTVQTSTTNPATNNHKSGGGAPSLPGLALLLALAAIRLLRLRAIRADPAFGESRAVRPTA